MQLLWLNLKSAARKASFRPPRRLSTLNSLELLEWAKANPEKITEKELNTLTLLITLLDQAGTQNVDAATIQEFTKVLNGLTKKSNTFSKTLCIQFTQLLAKAYYSNFLANISGGHYNPAVTLALWLRGKFSLLHVPGYMISQVLGAFVAGALFYFNFIDFFPVPAVFT